tara:strand:- start:9292 stop:11565 length:2274 start_codon:yes stop_codon:yes gene_type:complete
MANEKDAALQKQINALIKERMGLLADMMDAEQKAAVEAQARLEIQKEELELAQKKLAEEEKLTREGKAQASTMDIMGNMQESDLERAKKLVEQAKENVKATEETVKQTRHLVEAVTDAEKAGNRFAETMLGVDDRARMLGKTLTKDGKVIKNMGAQMGKVLAKMGESAGAASQIGRAFMKAEEGVVKLNDKLNQTAKKYGMMGAIERAREFEIFTKHSARDVGIITNEARIQQKRLFTEAVEGTVHLEESYHKLNRTLFQNSTAFRKASKSTRQELTLVAADLKQTFNVEGSTSVAVMQELGTTFGKTGKETAKLTADLAMMAQVQGRDVNKTLKDFADMSGQLAKYGLPSATQEFARLQAIEEKTGASMGNLVSSMETFSTFEGALNAASKLNAAFGTTIDGMELMDEMMTGGPAEALLLLRQRLDESGQSFDTMNFAQKRAMAEASGVGIQDLAKFMSVPFEELSQAVNESDGTIESLTNSQKKLAKATNGTLTATEAQDKLQEEQASKMAFAAETMESVSKSLAQMTNGWVAFGLAAAQSLGAVSGHIMAYIGKLLSLRAAKKADRLADSIETKKGIAEDMAETKSQMALNAAQAGGKGGFLRSGLGLGTMGSAGALSYLAGAAVVAGAGYAGYKMADSSGWLGSEGEHSYSTSGFASGQNMISKPTVATVGEAGSPEIANIGGQNYMVGMGGPQTVALGAGDSVATTGGEGGGQPQRVVMNFTFVDENGAKKTERIERVMKEYMNENLNLSYT